MERTPRSAYAGIFLLAGSIIMFEVALTRHFAIMMWHHFTYMVVSIALLGFGAAGSFLTARRDALRRDNPAPSVALWTGAYAISVVLAFLFSTQLRVETLKLGEDWTVIVALLHFYLIIAVPMFFGGLAIGKVLTRLARDVGRLYFADLVGSALGGLASVWLLIKLGNVPALLSAAALAALACVVFAFGARLRHVLASALPLLICGAVLISALGGSEKLGIPATEFEVPFAPGKELATYPHAPIEKRISSATAEVEISADHEMPPGIGGDMGKLDQIPVRGRFVAQDGTAPTMMYENAADIEAFPMLDDTQAGSSYVAFEASGREEPEVMVIGVGGGVDVMVALAHKARRVTAVEINSAMVKMVTEEYGDYLGGLFAPDYRDGRVELVNREGRSHLRHSKRNYDIIQMSGVDSFTALSTGAYTLSESYLYTVEAVQDFYSHLNDGGYINYSRFILSRPAKPRETLRLANIAFTALSELGVDDPAMNLCIFHGRAWASTMIKKGEFTAAEIDALRNYARLQGFRGFVFNPLRQEREGGFEVAGSVAGEIESFFGQQFARIMPADEAPAVARRFFVDGFLPYAENADESALAVAVESVVAPLPEAARKGVSEKLREIAAEARADAERRSADHNETARDFATLLRSSEDERRRFIQDYEYDLSPCTDDRPFFFNYYKWASVRDRILGRADTPAFQNRYLPDFPIGHTILFASLVQIMVLAAALIIWPLRGLRRDGVVARGKLRYFLYFAALGIGFMFVEIVLMQKMVIVLGHPTYALTVVLASILFFSGCGSFLAGRIKHVSRTTLLKLGLLVVAAIGIQIAASLWLLPALLGTSFAVRVAAVVLLLLPLGLALGTGFPTGIRILERNAPALLPWGWAINGFTSVLASILCIVLSQEFGFTAVLILAAAIYLLGFLVMKPEERTRTSESA